MVREVWIRAAATRRIAHVKFIRGFLVAFAVGGLAQGALLVMHVLLGRKIGPEAYGVFSFALGVATLLARVAPFGWHTAVTRFIAQYTVEKAWGLLRGVVRRSDQVTYITAAVAATATFALARAGVLEPQVSRGLEYAALMLPFLAVKFLRRRQLMGLHKAKLGLFLDEGAAPSMMIVVLVLAEITSAPSAIKSYAALLCAMAVTATILTRRGMPEATRTTNPEFQTRSWTATAVPLVLGTAGRMILNRIDIMMIGPMVGVYQVGLYSAAQRISYVLLFVPLIIGTIISPMVASAFYSKDLAAVRRMFLLSTGVSTAFAVPIAALLLLFPDTVMHLIFGQSFAGAAVLLQILLVGQFVYAITGPVETVMAMTGQGKAVGLTIAVIALFNIVGNYFAIQWYGAVGAASVTACSAVILSLWRLLLVRRHLYSNELNT